MLMKTLENNKKHRLLCCFVASEREGFKPELLKQTVTRVILCFQRFHMNHRAITATLGKINTAHKEPDMLRNKTQSLPKGHVLYLWLNTHTHLHTQIPPLSFIQQP